MNKHYEKPYVTSLGLDVRKDILSASGENLDPTQLGDGEDLDS